MTFELLLAILTGLGLAAACGFRVFVPLLVLSLAARGGHVSLASDFAWIGSTPALIGFGVATVLEIAAYYVPFVDNLLDTLATPLAAIAGTVVAASVVTDVEPWMRWSLAVVAGGGLATAVQIPTAAARGGSSVATAGVANSGVATGEVLAAGLVSGITVWSPILAIFLLAALACGSLALLRRRRRAAPREGSIADRRT